MPRKTYVLRDSLLDDLVETNEGTTEYEQHIRCIYVVYVVFRG